jgi:hypothetical protein
LNGFLTIVLNGVDCIRNWGCWKLTERLPQHRNRKLLILFVKVMFTLRLIADCRYRTYSQSVHKLHQRFDWLRYCTNIKTTNDFHTILTYFVYMIHKTGSKPSGSSSVLIVKPLYCNVVRLLALFFQLFCLRYSLLLLSLMLLRDAKRDIRRWSCAVLSKAPRKEWRVRGVEIHACSFSRYYVYTLTSPITVKHSSVLLHIRLVGSQCRSGHFGPRPELNSESPVFLPET